MTKSLIAFQKFQNIFDVSIPIYVIVEISQKSFTDVKNDEN